MCTNNASFMKPSWNLSPKQISLIIRFRAQKCQYPICYIKLRLAKNKAIIGKFYFQTNEIN